MQAYTKPENVDAEIGKPTRPAVPDQDSGSSKLNLDSTSNPPSEYVAGEIDSVAQEAEAEKRKGSDAYRRRDFNLAEEAFAKAWELSPKDISYLTNLSGISHIPIVWSVRLSGSQLCILSKPNMTNASALVRKQ